MKTTITLNNNDIKKIIAEHFNVSETSVNVNVVKDYEGYGMAEHLVCRVECTVTK